MQKQHGVGIFNLGPSAFYADFLYLIVTVAQAGGVDDVQRHAVDLDGLLHFVARGTSDGGNDGELGTRQGVEQRRLAGVRLASDDDFDAFAQECALTCTLHDARQGRLQAGQLTCGVGFLQEIDLFFREIQRRLDQHAQVDEGVAQRVYFLRKLARQAAGRTTGGRFGAGVNQIGHGLGLRQIHFVVQKCALGELTGSGDAQTRKSWLLGRRIHLSASF